MPQSARPREPFDTLRLLMACGVFKMVARLGAAPSISSSQARRIAVFLARD